MNRFLSRAARPVVSRPAAALPAGALALLSALPLHAQVSFTDVSDELDFTRSSVLQEGDGLAGAAWLDYDRDGWLDLYLTNGRTNPDGLYRNNGDGTFTNVSAAAGVASGEGATGVIAGDIDNDGDPDLFLSGDGGMMGLFGSPSPVCTDRAAR